MYMETYLFSVAEEVKKLKTKVRCFCALPRHKAVWRCRDREAHLRCNAGARELLCKAAKPQSHRAAKTQSRRTAEPQSRRAAGGCHERALWSEWFGSSSVGGARCAVRADVIRRSHLVKNYEDNKSLLAEIIDVGRGGPCMQPFQNVLLSEVTVSAEAGREFWPSVGNQEIVFLDFLLTTKKTCQLRQAPTDGCSEVGMVTEYVDQATFTDNWNV